MDNASKALIMAGAILIAVAIVGIGIYIFSSANSMTDDALNQIDSLTVTSINSQLQQYEGSVRGREVKQLINTARSINIKDAIPVDIYITFNKGTKTLINSTYSTPTSLTDNQTYTVWFNYDTATGYINNINVD